jgi:hypothetical protein
MPSMYRESDGAGDTGSVSLAIWEEDGELKHEHGAKPRVGVQMQVGSVTARTYASQDYWQTTTITEILEESETRVKFKTGNSVYIWEI